MDTIFINSENSKTSDPHKLLLNLSDMIKYFLCDLLCMENTKMINLKYQLRHGMRSLNYMMDHILYQIFKITLNIS